jgi:hypothetical protein
MDDIALKYSFTFSLPNGAESELSVTLNTFPYSYSYSIYFLGPAYNVCAKHKFVWKRFVCRNNRMSNGQNININTKMVKWRFVGF